MLVVRLEVGMGMGIWIKPDFPTTRTPGAAGSKITAKSRLGLVCKYEMNTTLYVFAISTDNNLTYIILVSTVSLKHLDQYIKFT